MKKLLFIIPLSFAVMLSAQQTPQYSQYVFNSYGHNPAFGGMQKCFDLKMGGRFQWVGFDNAPRSYFVSFNMPLKFKRYVKGTHAVGAYISQDQTHIIKHNYIYLGYTYHLRLAKKKRMAMGVFGGMQDFGVNRMTNDPLLLSQQSAYHYPDIMPGILFYNKTAFYGLSIQQVVPLSIKVAGDKNKLKHHYLFMMGKRILTGGSWNVFYSTLIKANFIAPPAIDLNLNLEYSQTFSFGLGYRVGEAINAQLKFKVGKIITLAYAFDYPLNYMRNLNIMGHEVMLGFSGCTPYGAEGQDPCPVYQ